MLRKNAVFIVVSLIGILLIFDIFLTRYNNSIIQQNKELQDKTGHVVEYYDQVGKYVIHSLDLGLRGYAISPTEKIMLPYNNAFLWRDSLLSNVETPLKKLGYDFKPRYNVFKDSLQAYMDYCVYMKSLLDSGQKEKFIRIFDKDRGGHLWYQYLLCEQDINVFVEKRNSEAQMNYEAALSRNQVLQIVLFVICFPTLLYTAVYTSRTFRLLELLRRTEEERNRILTEQNTTLEQFGFITAHNLRAPLARILGLGNIIRISSKAEEREMAIDKLLSSTRDLDQVIKDLNTILDLRRHTSNMKMVNVAEGLERVEKMLEKEMQEKNTAFDIDFDKTIEVYGVLPYVESVLYNLVSNAIKYRDPSRPPVIRISALRQEEFTLIKISDNGLGMDLQLVRNDLFGLYKRFHTHVEGRGIGLYLVKTQVEAMGGRLDVESQPGKGTTFLIYLRNKVNNNES